MSVAPPPAARSAPLRVAIVTTGRFHVCDLARELDARGHEVALYSLVPPARTTRFGLPPRCNRWLGPYLMPVYAACRAARRAGAGASSNRLLYAVVDRLVARVVAPCDVLIGMSQMSAAAMRSVRRRYAARTVLERGSRHIASQREILDRIATATRGAASVPQWAVARELAEYEIADVISVPARHVERSFVERGVTAGKLFRNPYGVDLDMFPATPARPPQAPPSIIMVGEWSMRKGCDVLAAAWRRLAPRGVRLLHVGRIGDAPLPDEPGFEHRGVVDQGALSSCYAGAHVFALASREEGLALVQIQALACGLPVVATDFTGAEDLREYVGDPRAIAIVPAGDVDALAGALADQLAHARTMRGVRDLLGAGRERLSWRAYGARYDAMLRAA